MASESVVLAFPRRMKRGRKVSRGPVADILEFPVALGDAKRLLRDLLEELYDQSPLGRRLGERGRRRVVDEMMGGFAAGIQEGRALLGRPPL